MFMCGSTCFGRLPTHHQEHTTALGASGFTVGSGWSVVVVWPPTRPRKTRAGFIRPSGGRICTAHITELNTGAQTKEAGYSYVLITELHRSFIAAC
jgi:hypothetical protein